MSQYPNPPSGSMPPDTAPAPNGEQVALSPIAEAACDAYVREYADYTERYGPPGMLWCVHDNQHILNWALTSPSTEGFERELAWLARVLEARDFPLHRLARGVELLAEPLTAAHPDLVAVAERISNGAEFLRSRPSFLD
jgi:hypothetical protein